MLSPERGPVPDDSRGKATVPLFVFRIAFLAPDYYESFHFEGD
jgi:hypothetical protein